MKKALALLVALSLILTLTPAAAFAQSSAISLEKAIQIAKGHFSIPPDYDQFDSTFEQDQYADYWHLRWYTKSSNDGYSGEISVKVNAQNGEIYGYNHYNSKFYQGKLGPLPKVSKKEGEKIAWDFIKKVTPSIAHEVILKPTDQVYSGTPVIHYYYFSRVINGIEYPNNFAHVEVSGETGEILNYYVNWESLKIAPLEAKITLEEAQKIFAEKAGFELRYFKPYPQDRASQPIQLVYEIPYPREVAIDAITGELVPTSIYYPYLAELDDRGMGSGIASSKLEPYEQQVVDELSGLLSKDEALKIAQKALNLSSAFKLQGSQLYRDWEFPQLKIWSFIWSMEEKNRYGWADVEVDAQTGKVIAFSCSEDSYIPGAKEERKLVIKTREEAEKLVQDYLRKNFPEVIGNLRPQKSFGGIIPLDEEVLKNQPSYSFSYERLVDGIPFSNNYVYASVNSYTGKIDSFRIRFLDLEFPAKDNVLDKDQFTQDFYHKYPLELVYFRDGEKNLRLVYKLPSLRSYRFDAHNGAMLDWKGQPIKEVKTPEIADISGHWAESSITTLNQLGLLRVVDNLYKPDAEITQAEVIKMLVKASNTHLTDQDGDKWYEPYYRLAKEKNLILEKEINPQAPVTREELAKFLVRDLMWDKIATLNIYKLDKYQDVNQVSEGYLGYVAIADGLGLLTGDGTKWNPKAPVKKGEACVVLVRYLKLDKK